MIAAAQIDLTPLPPPPDLIFEIHYPSPQFFSKSSGTRFTPFRNSMALTTKLLQCTSYSTRRLHETLFLSYFHPLINKSPAKRKIYTCIYVYIRVMCHFYKWLNPTLTTVVHHRRRRRPILQLLPRKPTVL